MIRPLIDQNIQQRIRTNWLILDLPQKRILLKESNYNMGDIKLIAVSLNLVSARDIQVFLIDSTRRREECQSSKMLVRALYSKKETCECHMNILRNLFRFSQLSNKSFIDAPKEYVHKLSATQTFPTIKPFRVIDLEGNVLEKKYDNIPPQTLNKIFDTMITVEEMDDILRQSQRLGRISFYMTSHGETATTVGAAAALDSNDLIFPQYREQGTFLWRGYTIEQIVNQCMGNCKDLGKGRQMPVHYGSKDLNIVTISSPLTTQVPQASGAGYGFRIAGDNRIAVTYFGEGAASEGDWHAAMNFAATLKSQTLFLCRNNHYAISTPTDDQFKGDSIAGKGPSYGIRTLKVDGNDVLAVFNAVKYARQQILQFKEPFLIEFITYRIGDHSTSDHSVLYRSQAEIDSWKSGNNPITRFGLYLKKSGFREFDDDKDKLFRAKVKETVIAELKKATEEQQPPIKDLFTDVYDKLTPNLEQQYEELKSHLNKYKQHYALDKFQGGL